MVGVTGVPIDQTFNGQTVTEPMPMAMGFALLCLAIIGLLIPAGFAFFTFRKQPEDAAINAEPMTSPDVESDPFSNDDPLPPTT